MPSIPLENPNSVTHENAPPPSSTAAAEPRPPRQVTKFEDTWGIVLPYCGWFDFELDPNFDHTKNPDYENEDDIFHVANPRETLIRHVDQVRKSFGFDVDCRAPSWFNGVFFPLDLTNLSSDPCLRDLISKVVGYAVAEISAEVGKKYELVKVEKVVSAHLFILFSTIRVKEIAVDEEKIIQAIAWEVIGSEEVMLFQWRYKPEVDDVWYELPPIINKRDNPPDSQV